MTFNNLQAEPAFITNEKYMKRDVGSSNHKRTNHKGLADCCYSFSNLALILGCILALIFATRFIQDDLLYTYIEHILTLRWYRQMVYVIVVMPLVLLVPLFNAASALVLSEQRRAELGKSLPVIKLAYEILMALLVFAGLVFVAPSIRYSTMASQIGYELKRHMKRRYDNDFSYEFLDRIQAQYECCDEPWYRANYQDKMPLTCFKQDGLYTSIYDHTCGEVLGALVSNRCSLVAVGLLIALVSLAILIALDLLDCLATGRRKYQVDLQQSQPKFSPAQQSRPTRRQPSLADLDESDLGESNEDIDRIIEDIDRPRSSTSGPNRLNLNERERERPLLEQPATPNISSQLRDDPFNRDSLAERAKLKPKPPSPESSPILTRARLVQVGADQPRTQSPVFADGGRLTPTKGVLKKSSSYQRITEQDERTTTTTMMMDQEDSDDIEAYQRQLQRQLQTRRSLLNVRFAE